jgi:hypothetical protein
VTNTYTCAVCGTNVYLDGDHVEVDIEKVRIEDRNDENRYLLHVDCAFATFDGWRCPA